MSAHDVVIIGGGPGGYLAAERLGAAGKKVLLVEKAELGGTCLNVGCIPTKTLLNSAKLYLHAREGEKFGVKAQGLSYDWAAMQAWKSEVTEKLRNAIALTEKKLGVEVLRSEARLVGPGRVEAGGEIREASAIIVATGSAPVMPPIPGARDNPKVLDSTGLLSIAEVPKSLCVIGGGVIGVEFAGLFAALGSKVEVVEMLDEIVPFMDKEQAPILRRAMKGVSFKLGCKVERIDGSSVVYRTKDGTEARCDADLVLMAVGRRPVVDGFGAKEAGLDCGPKGVAVDERMRTNLPGVWAVGDDTGRSLLAHSAYRMAEVAVADILSGGVSAKEGNVMRYDAVPWAVYGIPEAAGVGLTEQEALARGLAIKKASLPARVSGRFCAENGFAAQGSVKVVADAGDGRILGVHVVGAYASEMIWGGAALIEQELRASDVKQIVFPHPTVCEVIRDAVWELE
ncbi:MAG: dihydrolipoyl dehydrogenase [Spirochaetaceae bacterium]|nr:dihydrolipoyl dehydrogenase [Spirochaetaceae bacterium]